NTRADRNFHTDPQNDGWIGIVTHGLIDGAQATSTDEQKRRQAHARQLPHQSAVAPVQHGAPPAFYFAGCGKPFRLYPQVRERKVSQPRTELERSLGKRLLRNPRARSKNVVLLGGKHDAAKQTHLPSVGLRLVALVIRRETAAGAGVRFKAHRFGGLWLGVQL